MNKEINPMDKFSFLSGAWNLEYKVPQSRFSAGDTGEGEGEFKYIFENRYFTFDYHAELSSGKSAAHAIFAWDEKSKIYRYWWFEDSGAFMEAACNFLDDTTLCLNWYNSLLVQTFHRLENGNIVLQMKYPSGTNDYETILEVVLKKK